MHTNCAQRHNYEKGTQQLKEEGITKGNSFIGVVIIIVIITTMM
jgi:hypothetical protein